MYGKKRFTSALVILMLLVWSTTIAQPACSGGCSGCSSSETKEQTEINNLNDSATNPDENYADSDFEAVSDSEFIEADTLQNDLFSEPLENSPTESKKSGELTKAEKQLLIKLAVLFLLLVVLSYTIRFSFVRKIRGLILLATLIYLGFVEGGCPCMILSFQNSFLALIGQDIAWVSTVWFLALLPLTYFFGKIWCGWLCHLGALQEFLFKGERWAFWRGQKTQQILRIVQLSVLLLFVIQLLVTRTNLFILYDPFKVAFNLFSANTTGYVLLVILVISSALIYRPFCRTICPVGTILGWISKLPHARNLEQSKTCVNCSKCYKSCASNAILHTNGVSKISPQECILCGNCVDSCRKGCLKC